MSRLLGVLSAAAVGSVPGLVVLGLTIPVDGEAELTLGVAGTLVALAGAVTGAAAALALRSHR